MIDENNHKGSPMRNVSKYIFYYRQTGEEIEPILHFDDDYGDGEDETATVYVTYDDFKKIENELCQAYSAITLLKDHIEAL